MDWSKGYALIAGFTILIEYIRVRVDYQLIELFLITFAAMTAIALLGLAALYLMDRCFEHYEARLQAEAVRSLTKTDR